MCLFFPVSFAPHTDLYVFSGGSELPCLQVSCRQGWETDQVSRGGPLQPFPNSSVLPVLSAPISWSATEEGKRGKAGSKVHVSSGKGKA